MTHSECPRLTSARHGWNIKRNSLKKEDFTVNAFWCLSYLSISFPPDVWSDFDIRFEYSVRWMNSRGYLVVLLPRQPPIKTDKCLVDVESPLSPSFWLYRFIHCTLALSPDFLWRTGPFGPLYPVVLRGNRGKRVGELQSIHKYRNVPYFLEASVQPAANILPTYSCKSEWLAFQSWNDMHGLSPVRLANCMTQLRAVLRQCPTRREASGAKQRDKCPPELLWKYEGPEFDGGAGSMWRRPLTTCAGYCISNMWTKSRLGLSGFFCWRRLCKCEQTLSGLQTFYNGNRGAMCIVLCQMKLRKREWLDDFSNGRHNLKSKFDPFPFPDCWQDLHAHTQTHSWFSRVWQMHRRHRGDLGVNGIRCGGVASMPPNTCPGWLMHNINEILCPSQNKLMYTL